MQIGNGICKCECEISCKIGRISAVFNDKYFEAILEQTE